VADTRDALLSAASTLLAKEGPGALTVRRIAAEAGVSTMGVYSRFGGKDGVVDALLREGFDDLSRAMDSVPVTDDPLVDLQRCCQAYRTFGVSNATRYRLMFEGTVPDFVPSEESIGSATASFDRLVDRVGRCVDAGVLAPGDHSEIAASLWAASHGLISLELSGRKPESIGGDDPYERTMAAMIKGLSA
jgi:AcrR family transcriptional regulator